MCVCVCGGGGGGGGGGGYMVTTDNRWANYRVNYQVDIVSGVGSGKLLYTSGIEWETSEF